MKRLVDLPALVIVCLAVAGFGQQARAGGPGKTVRKPTRGKVVGSVVRPARRPGPVTPRARMRETLAQPDHRAGIRQITGRDLTVGQTKFRFRSPADPFVYQLKDGRVQVYGTFQNYLEFKSLGDFLRGGRFKVKKIPTRESFSNEAAWDQLIHRWPDGKEVLYSGAMTPTGGRAKPRWPADNWNRRIYAYTRDKDGHWVRHAEPLFNAIPAGTKPGMVGHAYGHHFKTIKRRVKGREVEQTWLFHEEVVAEGPIRTEMFARRMLNPFTASKRKVKILGTEWEGQPIGARTGGDLLVEGPRPFDVRLGKQNYSIVSFSSGDFSSDNYDIHFAWRKGDGIGPHTPYVDKVGGVVKLRGFAATLKKTYGLSWVGRAHVIRDGTGRYWAIFHGVDKAIRPEVDYTVPNWDLGRFQRNIYAVPMQIRMGKNGAPEIELLPDPR